MSVLLCLWVPPHPLSWRSAGHFSAWQISLSGSPSFSFHTALVKWKYITPNAGGGVRWSLTFTYTREGERWRYQVCAPDAKRKCAYFYVWSCLSLTKIRSWLWRDLVITFKSRFAVMFASICCCQMCAFLSVIMSMTVFGNHCHLLTQGVRFEMELGDMSL